MQNKKIISILSFQNKRCVSRGGGGATKKWRRLEKSRSPCYRKQVPFWGSWLRTQVSLSWRDELQRYGPRGIAGDCVAERKFRRGDLCSGARRASNEAGYFNEQILLSLPSVRSPHLALQWKGIFLRGVTYRLNHEWCHQGWRYHHGRHKLTTRLPIVTVSELASATRMTM